MNKKSMLGIVISISSSMLLVSCGLMEGHGYVKTEEGNKIEIVEDRELPRHRIIGEEDLSEEGNIRKVIYVEVEGERSRKDIEQLGVSIIGQYTGENDINSLEIYFTDSEIISSINTMSLGSLSYLSYEDSEAGDYSKHEYISNVKEKDWVLRPTEEEMKIASDFWEKIQEQYGELSEKEEDEDITGEEIAEMYGRIEEGILEELGTEYGYDKEEIKSIYLKVSSVWVFNDIVEESGEIDTEEDKDEE